MRTPGCEAFQRELLSKLELYLSGVETIADFRDWEVGITDSPEVPEEEQVNLDRLALVAENADFDIAPESDFRSLAEESVRRLRRELAAA
jgi:hypothetical protein